MAIARFESVVTSFGDGAELAIVRCADLADCARASAVFVLPMLGTYSCCVCVCRAGAKKARDALAGRSRAHHCHP